MGGSTEPSEEEIFGEWRILRYVEIPGQANAAKQPGKLISKHIVLGKTYAFFIESSCTAPVYKIQKNSTNKYLAATYGNKISSQLLGIKADSIYTVNVSCTTQAKSDNNSVPRFGGDLIYDGKKMYAFYNGTFYILEKNDD